MTSSSADDSPPATAHFFWRTSWILGLLVLSICLCLALVVIMRQQGYRREFEQALKAIRDAGEPLDGAEMNQFYAIPPGSNDLTQPYLLAIQQVHDLLQQKQPQGIKLPSMLGGSPPAEGEKEDPFADAEAILQEYEAPLAKLHELAHTPGKVRYPVDFTKGISALLEHVSKIRSAIRALKYEYAVRANAGDWIGANDSLFAMVKLSNTLKNEPVLISHLVRIATLSLTIQDIADHLASGQVPSQDLAQLQESLEEIDLRAEMQLAYMGERAFALQTLNNSSFQDMQAMGGEPSSHFASRLLTPFGKHMSDSRPGDCAKSLKFLTEMVNASKPDFPQCLNDTSKVSQTFKAFMVDEQKQMIWDRNILTGMLVPALDRIPPTTATAKAQVDCSITAIALERYRLAHKQFPAKLDELVPEFLSRVLPDPFTGKPLIYNVNGNEYKLYSVGKDGVDNQGDVGDSQSPDVGLKISIAPE